MRYVRPLITFKVASSSYNFFRQNNHRPDDPSYAHVIRTSKSTEKFDSPDPIRNAFVFRSHYSLFHIYAITFIYTLYMRLCYLLFFHECLYKDFFIVRFVLALAFHEFSGRGLSPRSGKSILAFAPTSIGPSAINREHARLYIYLYVFLSFVCIKIILLCVSDYLSDARPAFLVFTRINRVLSTTILRSVSFERLSRRSF